MSNTAIHHPILGVITDVYEGSVWRTAPIKIGTFGYEAEIEITTEEGPPTGEQLAAAAKVASSDDGFRDEVADYMKAEYTKYIRPSYLKTVGDPAFKRNLTEADLPEINSTSDIWKVIEGFNGVCIDEEGNLSLEFVPKFDRGHDFAVRFEDGELYEVLMDG